MFKNKVTKRGPILDDGYAKMAEHINYFFEQGVLDHPTALSLFYLSYEMESIHWNLMPFRGVARNSQLARVLRDMSEEIYFACRDVSGYDLFREYMGNACTSFAMASRYDIAQAMTRASIILSICNEYKDAIDYRAAASLFRRNACLKGEYTNDAEATLALVMICSYLKHGGLIMFDKEGEILFRYGNVDRYKVHDVLVRDLNSQKSGKEWFRKNSNSMFRHVCRDYKKSNLELTVFGFIDCNDEEW